MFGVVTLLLLQSEKTGKMKTIIKLMIKDNALMQKRASPVIFSTSTGLKTTTSSRKLIYLFLCPPL